MSDNHRETGIAIPFSSGGLIESKHSFQTYESLACPYVSVSVVNAGGFGHVGECAVGDFGIR